jgi:predicted chitinase
MRATELIIENDNQAAVDALLKKHGWSMGRTVNGDLYFTWQGLTYEFYGERVRINWPNGQSVSVVWGKKPDWHGRPGDISFAQAVQQKYLTFDLPIWQALDRKQINDAQAMQQFKIENERQAREAVAQGVSEGNDEQAKSLVDLAPNYPNYKTLVGEFIGIRKNRARFLIVSSELKPGVREADTIFRARTTNTPISIEISKVKNRKVIEDISRRGFLGGVGAAALGAGQANAKVAPQQPKREEPINMLSNYPQHEALLQRAAKAAGIKGIELAQFMAQTNHESWDFSRLKEKGLGQGYFAKKYDRQYAPRTAQILGNKHIGDGEKYHGRGFIQLTGRDNYRMASQALGIDLLKNPELAERPDVAAKIAVWYWQTRVKPYINNFNDTKAVTKKINPAMRGLQDRHAKFIDYKNIL